MYIIMQKFQNNRCSKINKKAYTIGICLYFYKIVRNFHITFYDLEIFLPKIDNWLHKIMYHTEKNL